MNRYSVTALREAQDHIDGKIVARMIIEFHDQFRTVYPHAVLVSDLCAVGPLQAMIGLAIAQGRLSLPSASKDNSGPTATSDQPVRRTGVHQMHLGSNKD